MFDPRQKLIELGIISEAQLARLSYTGIFRCPGTTVRGQRCRNASPWWWSEIEFGTYRCHIHGGTA